MVETYNGVDASPQVSGEDSTFALVNTTQQGPDISPANSSIVLLRPEEAMHEDYRSLLFVPISILRWLVEVKCQWQSIRGCIRSAIGKMGN